MTTTRNEDINSLDLDERSALQTAVALEAFFSQQKIRWSQRSRFMRAFLSGRGTGEEKDLITEGNPFNMTQYFESEETKRQTEQYFSMGIRAVFPGTAHWPSRLSDIEDPPLWLWYKGLSPSCLNERAPLAVVGSRRCFDYGRNVCREIVFTGVRRGHAIVSGLARGIDGLSHRFCLEAGGLTAAFMPCGLEDCYPAEHKNLLCEIEQYGCIMSEFPPHYPLRKENFHSRNRLISGVSSAVIVVQAAKRSGTLITAHCAAEQGRPVWVVPATWYMKEYAGSLELITDGAMLLDSADRICEFTCPEKPYIPRGKTALHEDLSVTDTCGNIKDQQMILGLIGSGSYDETELSEKVSLNDKALFLLLYELEREKFICKNRGKYVLTERGISCIYCG